MTTHSSIVDLSQTPIIEHAQSSMGWLPASWLEALVQLGRIRAIDAEFARFVCEQQTQDNARQASLFLATYVSYALGKKHVCVDIQSINWHDPFELGAQCVTWQQLSEQIAHKKALENQTDLSLPDAHVLREQLRYINGLQLTDAANTEVNEALLVGYQQRIYTQRYWQYEQQLAQQILRFQQVKPTVNMTLAKQWLQGLFPDVYLAQAKSTSNMHSQKTDWQLVACALAALNGFAVITGGPGTGKTTTVTKLLLLLVALSAHDNANGAMVMRLVAPTGKAAARLTESIKAAKQRLLDQLRQRLPTALAQQAEQFVSLIEEEASTIHRLLGVLPNSSHFRHHQQNLLHVDLLVVDEVSMVDLPLMTKLFSALPTHTRVVLLGDKDQLASVEAGSVLGDICGELAFNTQGAAQVEHTYSAQQAQALTTLTGFAFTPNTALTQATDNTLHDSIAMLQKSHRFDANSGIGQLAAAINQHDAMRVSRIVFKEGECAAFDDLRFFDHHAEAVQSLIDISVEHYRAYLDAMVTYRQHIAEHATEIIRLFNQFRVLCALRESEHGIKRINAAIEHALVQAHLLSPSALRAHLNQQYTQQLAHSMYAGRPIMITENNYQLGLFNGDVGLILPDVDSRLKAWFVMPDGSVKSLYTNRLPAHDTVYAMTIHKSQGSEFDHVALLLPDHRYIGEQSLMTRELIYTGVTRAKHHLDVFCPNEIIQASMRYKTQRYSGLKARLWG